MLRWQLSSMVDAIGGDLVSKYDADREAGPDGLFALIRHPPRARRYGLTLSLEAEPWAGTAISDPLLLLFIVALVNEASRAGATQGCLRRHQLSHIFAPASPQVLLHLGVMQQVSRARACLVCCVARFEEGVGCLCPAQTAEEKQEEALSYDLRAQEHYGESFQQLEP